MGQKAHPTSLRLFHLKPWNSNWLTDKRNYIKNLYEDNKIRKYLLSSLPKEIIAKIIIERTLKSIKVTIQSSLPGKIIGPGGAKITKCTKGLKKITNMDVQINVFEIRNPELYAKLVAASIAQQIEKFEPYKKAMKNAISNTMNAGAKGIKVCIKGRLNGKEIARAEWESKKQLPSHTLRADIDYALVEAQTSYGILGIKVWIFRKYVYGKRDLSLNLEVKPKPNFRIKKS